MAKVFSFRAECQRDVDELLLSLKMVGHVCETITIKPLVWDGCTTPTGYSTAPDVSVQLDFVTDVTEEILREHLSHISDTHYITQTLKPVSLAENDLKRPWQIKRDKQDPVRSAGDELIERNGHAPPA